MAESVKRHYLWVRVIIFIASAAAFTAFAFFSGGRFLSSPASLPQKSDLIIVLGGDSGFRAPKALELVQSIGHRAPFDSQ